MKSEFGIEFRGEEEALHFADRLPHPFTLFALDGELVGRPKVRKRFLKPVAGMALTVTDLIAPELARQAAEAPEPLVHEFFRLFRERCRQASELRAAEFTIDFDLARAFGEEAYRSRLLAFLRGCYGILHEFRLVMRLAWRPPEGGEAARRFLFDTLFSGVGLALEGDPAQFPAGNWLEPVKFQAEFGRFRLEEPFGERVGMVKAMPAQLATRGFRAVFAVAEAPEELLLEELAALIRGDQRVEERELFPITEV